MTEHRRMTPTAIRSMMRGAERLGAPGVWVDREGAMHFSIPEMLAHLGVENTPANRDELTKIVEAMIATSAPDCEVIVTEPTTDG
jgi:hypothetical protein